MPQTDLVKTGIAGLDDILPGGIPRGNVILVAGAIGTGKTTIGVEFVYWGAHQFDEPGIIVLFEVSPNKLMRDALQLGWNLEELERQNRLKIVFTTRDVLRQEPQQADSVLLAEASKIGARRIFLDFGDAPGYPGYFQVNFRVPNGIPSGSASMRLRYLDRPSNQVSIAIVN